MPRFKSFVYDLIAIFRPEMIDGRCTVKFRMPPRYRACVAPFGFDWMRTGDSLDYVVLDIPYKENIGRYYSDSEMTQLSAYGGHDMFFSNFPNMYEQLCRKYLPGNLKVFPSEEGKAESYHVPVLSIFPYSNGHQALCFLSLEIVIKREIRRIQFEFDKTLFDINGVDNLPIEKGKHIYNISIKCIKELDQDEYIYVTSVNRRGKVRKAGVLRVCKNAKTHRRSLNILLVNIKCLSSDDAYATVLSSTTQPARKSIECTLHHALITPVFEDMELDLGYDAEIAERFKEIEGRLCFVANENQSSDSAQQTADTSYYDLSDILSEKLEAIKDIDQYNVIVYCMGVELVIKENNDYNPINGYSDTKFVMLSISYTGTTAAHEVFHTLGLSHSFDNFHQDHSLAKFTYKIFSTDNIMDYTHITNIERTNLWEWQWEKMREACTPES